MLRRLGLLIASVLVTLATVEIALRLFAPIPRCDHSLDVRFAQTIAGLHDTVAYSRDLHGMRRDAPPPRIPALRILCLGASTTDQATQNWEDTWCARLARALEEAMGSEVAIEAAAFGRGGMGIAQTAAELPRLIDEFQPGLVIVLVGINDVTWQRGVDQRYAREAATTCSEPAGPSPSDFQILRRLSLAMNARRRTGTSLVPGQLEWHSENLPTIRARFQQLPEVVPAENPAIVERFTRDLRRIVSDATRHGAAILLLGQPFLWKDELPHAEQARLWFAVRTEAGLVRASPGWLQREMRELNEAQRQLARESGARFLDLEPLVPKDLYYFFDDCHFTDRGSAVVAEAVLPVALDLVRARQDRALGR